MIFVGNRVLTNVKYLVDNEFTGRKVVVVSTATDAPASFPTLEVKTVSNYALGDDLEDGDEENAVMCLMSVTAYSDKSLQECYKLISVANKAMYRMGFKRNSGPYEGVRTRRRGASNDGVVQDAQTNVLVVNARYVRAIGGNDEIPRFADGE